MYSYTVILEEYGISSCQEAILSLVTAWLNCRAQCGRAARRDTFPTWPSVSCTRPCRIWNVPRYTLEKKRTGQNLTTLKIKIIFSFELKKGPQLWINLNILITYGTLTFSVKVMRIRNTAQLGNEIPISSKMQNVGEFVRWYRNGGWQYLGDGNTWLDNPGSRVGCNSSPWSRWRPPSPEQRFQKLPKGQKNTR